MIPSFTRATQLDAPQESVEQQASRTEKYGECAAQTTAAVVRQKPIGMAGLAGQERLAMGTSG